MPRLKLLQDKRRSRSAEAAPKAEEAAAAPAPKIEPDQQQPEKQQPERRQQRPSERGERRPGSLFGQAVQAAVTDKRGEGEAEHRSSKRSRK